MSRTKYLQDLAEEYRASGRPWPASAEAMAGWAISQRRWQPSGQAAIRMCAHEIADALREEYWTDPRGRKVRAKHPMRTKVDGEQRVLWDDIRSADRDFMEVAFQQRRTQIVGDCRQLKTDVDSFNEFGKTGGRLIQMVLDFTDDVAELESV